MIDNDKLEAIKTMLKQGQSKRHICEYFNLTFVALVEIIKANGLADYKNKTDYLNNNKELVIELINAGLTRRELTERLDVGICTLDKFLKANGLKSKHIFPRKK